MATNNIVETKSLEEAIEYFEKKYKNIATKSDKYEYFSELSYFIGDNHTEIQNLNLNNHNWDVRLINRRRYKFLIWPKVKGNNRSLTLQEIAILKKYSSYVLENKSTMNSLYKNRYFLIYLIIFFSIILLQVK